VSHQGSEAHIEGSPQIADGNYIDFLVELRANSFSPVDRDEFNGDQILGRLCAVTIDRLRNNDQGVKWLIEDFLSRRPDLDTVHAYHLYTKAFNKQARRLYVEYPRIGREDGFWDEVYERIFRSSVVLDDLQYDLYNRVVNRCLPDRGKLLSLLIAGCQAIGRLPDEPTGIEGGGGRPPQLIEKMQSIGATSVRGYSPLTVLHGLRGDSYANSELKENGDMTVKCQAILSTPRKLGAWLVVDKIPMHDHGGDEWDEAQINPEEEINESWKLEEQNILKNMKSPNIEHLRIDMADPKFQEMIRYATDGSGVNVVYIPTSLYQNPADKRKAIFESSVQLADEFAIFQDWIYVSANNRRLPRIYRRTSAPWRYGFWVLDKRQPDTLQPLMVCDNASVNRVIMGSGTIKSGNQSYSMEDLIDSATG
jgi:hypothetical protein